MFRNKTLTSLAVVLAVLGLSACSEDEPKPAKAAEPTAQETSIVEPVVEEAKKEISNIAIKNIYQYDSITGKLNITGQKIALEITAEEKEAWGTETYKDTWGDEKKLQELKVSHVDGEELKLKANSSMCINDDCELEFHATSLDIDFKKNAFMVMEGGKTKEFVFVPPKKDLIMSDVTAKYGTLDYTAEKKDGVITVKLAKALPSNMGSMSMGFEAVGNSEFTITEEKLKASPDSFVEITFPLEVSGDQFDFILTINKAGVEKALKK